MTQQFVYGRPVIDFVTTAVQVCLVLEHIEKISREEFADKMLNLLPQLYVQIRQIDVSSQESSDGFLERFVTEDEYNTIADNIKRLLGSDDAYLEVFVEDMQYSDKPITQFISENLADIYQELKDMAFNYQTEDLDTMCEAIINIAVSFREHWGQKLLNCLRPIHALSQDWSLHYEGE